MYSEHQKTSANFAIVLRTETAWAHRGHRRQRTTLRSLACWQAHPSRCETSSWLPSTSMSAVVTPLTRPILQQHRHLTACDIPHCRPAASSAAPSASASTLATDSGCGRIQQYRGYPAATLQIQSQRAVLRRSHRLLQSTQPPPSDHQRKW